jgi:hypothetical protein
MGFFSKVFKGVKKVFKKVGKAIKSGLKSVGKFMDKIGIVGQIGLSLLLPGIGSLMSGMWGSLVGGMQAYSGLGSTIVNGAGNFLNAATKVASRAGRAFSSITEGVKNVVGETLKLGAKKLGLGQVASNIGTKFGSKYFTKLGNSISNASFDNIGNAFGMSKEKFLSSFSGDAFLPDSAYEAARQSAANISPEKILDITPPTPQFADPDLATPDMPASMTEVKVTAPQPPLTEGDKAFMAAREQALADLPAVGEKQSLLGKAYDETIARGRQLISDAPQLATRAVEKGIESSVVTGVRRLTGVEQAPEYETTYYGTYVPQLDFSDTAIATPSAQFNPVQFAAANTELMNMYPFGATAQLYNDATYGTQMRQYGYA